MVSRRRVPFIDQQLIDLYEKGMIDREIAFELGIHRHTVSKRRRKLGLKANDLKLLFTDQQLITLYERGLNDREIGEKLGAGKSTVNDRRRILGLKPIRKQGIKSHSRATRVSFKR